MVAIKSVYIRFLCHQTIVPQWSFSCLPDPPQSVFGMVQQSAKTVFDSPWLSHNPKQTHSICSPESSLNRPNRSVGPAKTRPECRPFWREWEIKNWDFEDEIKSLEGEIFEKCGVSGYKKEKTSGRSCNKNHMWKRLVRTFASRGKSTKTCRKAQIADTEVGENQNILKGNWNTSI